MRAKLGKGDGDATNRMNCAAPSSLIRKVDRCAKKQGVNRSEWIRAVCAAAAKEQLSPPHTNRHEEVKA